MKIFSWNVNGIRAIISKGEFAKFIDEYKPDVLCIQETKAKQGQAEIDLPDYEEFWNSAERPGYSGTAIFSKIKPLSVRYGFSDSINSKYNFVDKYGDVLSEGRVTTAEFDEFFLVTVYTPNAKGDLTRLGLRDKVWDPAFLDYVKELEESKPMIFCGDLNVAHREIDLANPKQNVGKHGFTSEERAGFANYLSVGLIDTFRSVHGDKPDQYTWWSHWAKSRERNIGWRIDYFLASESLENRITDAEIYPDQMGSDHCPISITIKEG